MNLRFFRLNAAPGGPGGNGVPFDATGTLPCATAAGQPTKPCPFGVVREGPGNAGVWIALGDGDERHILFKGGAPVATDIDATLGYDKEADLYGIGRRALRDPLSHGQWRLSRPRLGA